MPAGELGVELRLEGGRPASRPADVVRHDARLADEERLVERVALVEAHLEPVALVAGHRRRAVVVVVLAQVDRRDAWTSWYSVPCAPHWPLPIVPRLTRWFGSIDLTSHDTSVANAFRVAAGVRAATGRVAAGLTSASFMSCHARIVGSFW